VTTPYYSDDAVTLHHGDALEVLRGLPDASADCVVTSPPYFGLRDYGQEGQYGLEETPAEYVEQLRLVFAEIRRVLVDDGTAWLNLGDSYAGKANAGQQFTKNRGRNVQPVGLPAQRNMLAHAPYKSMLGIPWRVALALVDDGWTLRNDVIWSKPNAMPESIADRLSGRHEHVFLLTKGPRYWFDLDAIREERKYAAPPLQTGQYGHEISGGTADPWSQRGSRYGGNAESAFTTGVYKSEGRNPGDVWTVPTAPFPEAHFAAMPPALAERCVLAGCRPGGIVLDPFSGSGTTGLAAARHGRRYVGIDLSADYLDLSLRTRLAQGGLLDTPGAAS
jgi:site-specific DNA-methyltransferase (cytosine-N4-specific)